MMAAKKGKNTKRGQTIEGWALKEAGGWLSSGQISQKIACFIFLGSEVGASFGSDPKETLKDELSKRDLKGHSLQMTALA